MVVYCDFERGDYCPIDLQTTPCNDKFVFQIASMRSIGENSGTDLSLASSKSTLALPKFNYLTLQFTNIAST